MTFRRRRYLLPDIKGKRWHLENLNFIVHSSDQVPVLGGPEIG